MSVFISCSTKKNKWNRRVYHNVTAHYNAYYNGVEALKQAQKSIKQDNFDDYSKVLDVFQLGEKEQVGAYIPQFERAKKKASIVIHKHSMEFREKEHVKWVYYSYMLIGKANFYAQEYMLAEQNFKYILVKYNNEDIKHDARMWMALSQIRQEKYEDARSNLMTLRNRISKSEASKELVRMLPMVFADLYLQQKMYSSAIGPLKLAIESNKKKKVKARLTFILAQVYHEMGNLNEASTLYKKTLGYNPEYIMDFNARINIAKCFDGSSRDGKKVKELLMDMVEDSKNKEFLDQIYYTLAEVQLKEKNTEKAVEYLELSVLTSVNNNKQKAFSALKLADIYFDQKNYENAQAYYDSTMMFIPKEYEEYDKLEDRSLILNELVNNLIQIKAQDSLIRIASMPERERSKFINELIEIELQKERAEKEAEAERMRNAQFMEQNRMETTRSVTQGGNQKWYFYNNTAMSFGFTEFQTKWGQRKLEDNWRISNKTSLKFVDEEEQMDDLDSAKSDAPTKKDKEFYLQNLPLTQSELDSSNKIIEDALFNCGVIYREKLLNPENAVESFEELLNRYDSTHYKPQAYYYLTKLYTNLNNSLQAKKYKESLQNEFPNSDFAKLISDPNFYKTLEESKNKASNFYKKTYQAYLDGDYKTTINNCAIGKKEYRKNESISAKFALLHAFALVKTADTMYFLNALDKVVQDFPNTEQGILANEISLRVRASLRGETNQQSNQKTEETEKSIYSVNDEATHMFVALVNLKNQKVNDIKNELSNHNSQYFSSQNLNISSIPLTKDIVMVGVSNFSNKKTAMNYRNTMEHNLPLFNLLNKTEGDNFVISDGNYTLLYKTKKIDEYKSFFKKNYE